MDVEQFVRTELDPLLRFARVLTGDRGTAEDMVQDVVGTLWASPGRLDDVQHPVAYVRKMVVNRYLSWGRTWFRVRPSATALPDVRADDPADVVAVRQELSASLAGLPRKQRAVLVMRYYLDLDDAAIAAALGCGTGTVRSHASRGLAALRVTLTDDLDRSRP